MPYENPQGRWVNTVAAPTPIAGGPPRSLTWATERGALLAEQVLHFPGMISPPYRPRLVVVLDNDSAHTSHAVPDARPHLAQRGIELYSLPP